MRVTIHQPEFAPWLGFFDKVGLADRLIILDDVQFRKNYFHNRNRILGNRGPQWITIPTVKDSLSTPINAARIANDKNPRWRHKIKASLEQCYGSSIYFEQYRSEFFPLIDRPAERLVELTIPALEWLLSAYSLAPQITFSSALAVEATGSDRILELCRRVGATTYISGISGRDYLDLQAFEAAGIQIEFQSFFHPIYPQLIPGFTPLISALEPLFIQGPGAKNLLQPHWEHRLEEVFL